MLLRHRFGVPMSPSSEFGKVRTMLKPEDRRAIEGLFDRLQNARAGSGPRDREAEELIHQRIRETPGSPYYMAQTVLVQEHALKVAEQRIAELEQQVRSRSSGTAFGNRYGERSDRGYGQGTEVSRQPRGPWGPIDDQAQSPQNYNQPYGQQPNGGGFGGGRFGGGFGGWRLGGGGFLAGAAQTAMGVAGGVMLGNAIGSMFGGGEAHAAEVQPVDAGHNADGGNDAGQEGGQDAGAEDPGADYGNDAGGDFGNDAGGDFGGGDGFDFGGDF